MRFALTIFLSAFLLFSVQLVMGKLVLPWFGGVPAVWTTCMLFFQVGLLLGYAWAHFLAARFDVRRQRRAHGVLLAAAAGLILATWWLWGSPLLAPDSWKPEAGDRPVVSILVLLGSAVGLPFVALAATSPLLQHWHALGGAGRSAGGQHTTYRLYAASNTGSLLALLAYPFLVERWAALPVQAAVWAVAFFAFVAGVWACGRAVPAPPDDLPVPGAGTPGDGAAVVRADRPGLVQLGLWALLACAASAVFLSVTNQLCQEVAAVPFLWVVPLAVYLLSFIICFDRPAWYRREFWLGAAAVLTVVVLIAAFLGVRMKIPAHIVIGAAFLFAFCMVCHGELFRSRPAPVHLTSFYLAVAAGGALGGFFTGVLAPWWFRSYWEFHIALTLAWVLLATVFWRDRESPFHTGSRWLFAVLSALSIYIVLRLATALSPAVRQVAPWLGSLAVAATVAALAAALLSWAGRRRKLPARPVWPKVLVGLIVFLAECFMLVRVRSLGANALAADRNFFGTLEVRAFPADGSGEPPYVQLNHGQINHGLQIADPVLRNQPVSYYGEGSGVHLAATRHPRKTRGGDSSRGTHATGGADTSDPQPFRIGVLGLGVGTMAAFAGAGDTVRFYEINPLVVEYSSGDRPFFTYLRDCRGAVEVELGDARLALERELAAGRPGRFDLLAMDAFSSDSVPAHLLTREAFGVYASHLRDDDSVIAVNISNRFLDLRDLVVTLGEEAGFQSRIVVAPYGGLEQTASLWVLLTRSGRVFDHPDLAEKAQPWEPRERVVWTDQFSSLFGLLR